MDIQNFMTFHEFRLLYMFMNLGYVFRFLNSISSNVIEKALLVINPSRYLYRQYDE